jgi:quercetin dioxygenase-like cupin family protein
VPGAILTLGNGITHEVEALEDSAFALTVIQPGRQAHTNP